MVRGSRVRIFISTLVLLPGIACATFASDTIGQSQGISSMLIQPPIGYLTHESDPIIFKGPFDASRMGISMSYSEPLTGASYLQGTDKTIVQDLSVSATAVGEYALSSSVDLFGKIGIRYLSRDDIQGQALIDNITHSPQFDRRYGLGIKVKASDVLSLHFEWERYAQGDTSAAVPALGSSWDPWREHDVFGAGVRLGF